jgi:two-component system, cell cycle sensor histidine kinase and response regulator CckA
VNAQANEHRRREHLVALVEMMDEHHYPVLAVDDAGRVVHANRAGRSLTGWSTAQDSEQPLAELFAPDTGAAHGDAPAPTGIELLDRYVAGAVLVVPATLAQGALSAHGAQAAQAAQAAQLSGLQLRRFRTQLVPVHDAEGAVCGAVISFRDRSGSPYLVRDAHEMLQLVMNNIPQFIFWKDTDSIFLGCNRNFARVAGVEQPEDIVGKTDYDLPWRKEEADYFREVDQRVMRTSTSEHRIVEPQLQASGKQAWIETTKLPLRDEHGNVVGVLGTFEDITERRELEEQLRHAQKMKAVGQLAGGIAHDFNNLLTAIACHAELAMHTVERDSSAYADLEQIMHAIRHAADLTQQLLTFSRRRVVQQRLIRVNDVVLGISTMLRPLIRANAEMATILAASGHLRMDPGELEQVIVNLVVNSSNAMPSGGTLTIETSDLIIGSGDELPHGDVTPGGYVSIRVADTGTGMPPEVKERIFEPFFTTKGPGEGTGLGLAIVYGIVTRAAGFIHVDSEVGQGTVFDILLPAAEPMAHETTERAPAYDPPRGTETVLLVEDEAAVRHLADRILSDLGYTVLPAANGEEALRVAGAHGLERIDLVLTDVVMPVMSGTEMVERLLARRPDLRILFTSGYPGTAGVDRFLDEDAGFLQKPFTMDVLTQKVREVLDGHARGATSK